MRIDTVGSVQLGRQRSPKHHAGEHMRPYLRVANVYEDRINLSSVMEMNFTPAEYITYALHTNDVLLNEGQSTELVGRPAIYRDELPGCCFTNTLVRFRAFGALLPKYALIVFRHYLWSGAFRDISKVTTTLAHLGAGRFAEMAIPIPSLKEQYEIVDKFDNFMTAVNVAETDVIKQLSTSNVLRQTILKAAFTGQLIPQDPNDEPASELLKRIAEDKATTAPAPKKRRAGQPKQQTSEQAN